MRPSDRSADRRWTIEHTRRYLNHEIGLYEFWRPIPRIEERYGKRSATARDRVRYFFRQVYLMGFDALRWGESGSEENLRRYLKKMLVALELPYKDWMRSVKHWGRPLDTWAGGNWRKWRPESERAASILEHQA